jgi:hypothetical protein
MLSLLFRSILLCKLVILKIKRMNQKTYYLQCRDTVKYDKLARSKVVFKRDTSRLEFWERVIIQYSKKKKKIKKKSSNDTLSRGLLYAFVH